jgi:hypothetical protein
MDTMQAASSNNLVTLIDSADERGRVCFPVPNTGPMRTKEQARQFLAALFRYNAAVTLRLARVKKFINEIDLVLAPAGGNHTVLVVNLAKLLQLPSVMPSDELAAFREMALDMRAFHEAYSTEQCSIELFNERDRGGRVYGSISCRAPTSDEAATASLNARIGGNQALTHWLLRMARGLQRIGPWSSAVISENDLFGYSAGPYARHQWRQVVAGTNAPADVQEQMMLLHV